MSRSLLSVIGAAAVVAALASPARAQVPQVPQVPTGLEVPAGNELFLATRAAGTQNYICMPSGKRTVAWRFLGPQATVFEFASGAARQIATHFLSVNQAEGSLTRPTWQHSEDSSLVWGRVVAASSDPAYVAPNAIPWLRLVAAGTALGPTGGGILAPTTFIQRVNTSGGVAPSSGCSDDDHVGTMALVPYTTDYFFYRAIQ